MHIKESTNKAIFNPEALEFHASCAEGLHEFLEQEVKDLGLKLTSANRGGVFFKGKKESVQKFLLTTRFSSRVSFSISQLRVEDAEDLYDQAVRLPWEEIIAKGLSFKITKRNIQRLIDAGLNVAMRATITSFNHDNMLDIAKVHKELGGSSTAYVPLNPVEYFFL